MLKYSLSICLFIFYALNPAQAAENIRLPAAILAEIPAGWHLFASTKGELSKDKYIDYAIIVEKDVDEDQKLTRFHIMDVPPYINSHATYIEESFRAPRKLMVFAGQKNKRFFIAFIHSDWVERSDFGGMMGDAFDGLEINNGSILLKGFIVNHIPIITGFFALIPCSNSNFIGQEIAVIFCGF